MYKMAALNSESYASVWHSK